MEFAFSNERFNMKLNERFKFNYCFQKPNCNAGRLLLNLTRGVYFLISNAERLLLNKQTKYRI
jgi:hypothetical protein